MISWVKSKGLRKGLSGLVPLNWCQNKLFQKSWQKPAILVLRLLELPDSNSLEQSNFGQNYIKMAPWEVESDQPPPQALRFSHRGEHGTRVTSDEAQGTIGRRKMRGKATRFSPSRPPLRANFHQERLLGTRQESDLICCFVCFGFSLFFFF